MITQELPFKLRQIYNLSEKLWCFTAIFDTPHWMIKRV